MIVCFRCSKETRERLEALLETGQYKDHADVISVAVANLSVLHRELAGKAVLVIGDQGSGASDGDVSPEHSTTSRPRRISRVRGRTKDRQADAARSLTLDTAVHIPDVFRLDGIGEPPPRHPDLPSDVWAMGQQVPLDRWIFGQYNKLLPAKANCRALAHLLARQSTGVSLKEAASTIADEAAELGEYLRRHDARHGVMRDTALSTAFPAGEKGRRRYATQFVAAANTNGQVSGLMIDLKLINYTHGQRPRLLLTQAGWRFAAMHNPVLDLTLESPDQKFSPEEAAFVLEHIATHVPAEDFAYRAILGAISEGADTPDALDAALEAYIPSDAAQKLSRSFFQSQRSGAISRMADLGLVTRVREGVRVSYTVTDTGDAYRRRRPGSNERGDHHE